MSLSPYPLALLLLVGYLAYSFIIYPRCISQLAALPVPHWSCHLSSFWILRARKCGTENASLRDAHRRLGNIVRVSPDTISVDGVDAMRIIYQGGFPKAPWYRIFDNYGYVGLLVHRGTALRILGCLACSRRLNPRHIQNGNG